MAHGLSCPVGPLGAWPGRFGWWQSGWTVLDARSVLERERKKVGLCETWLHNPAIALAKLYPFPKSEEEGEMITIENS